MKILNFIGECLAAAMIVGAPFWFSWGYYFLTGEYLDFGGGQ